MVTHEATFRTTHTCTVSKWRALETVYTVWNQSMGVYGTVQVARSIVDLDTNNIVAVECNVSLFEKSLEMFFVQPLLLWQHSCLQYLKKNYIANAMSTRCSQRYSVKVPSQMTTAPVIRLWQCQVLTVCQWP